MESKNQNTVFVHAGTGCVIERKEYAVNKMFFNKMYLLGDKLYDCLNKVMVEKPINIMEKADFLLVEGNKYYYLFDNNGNRVVKSLREIEVYHNGWFSYFDDNGIKKLFNNKFEIVIENFEKVNFYVNGWYVVKFDGETALYDESDEHIYSCQFEIDVDDEHNRFVVCYSEDKMSVFEKDLTPVVLDVEAFINIDNIYIIKRDNCIEIFANSTKGQKDKSIWKGSKDDFLSVVCIMDVDNDADVLIEKLLKS